MTTDFCCKMLAKSHTLTAMVALWHSYIFLGAAVSHVLTIWAPRHYWLTALPPEAGRGELWRYAVDTGPDWVYLGITDIHMGHHGIHIMSGPCLNDDQKSQGGTQPKQFAVNQRRESSSVQLRKPRWTRVSCHKITTIILTSPGELAWMSRRHETAH